ncbi:MAG: hypothetical protein NUV78_00535 [Candidatus Zambryskibacteria bacterium]|nr:hypothetical protein [Candidatus Zambryskibacteria bacterium]
MNNLQFTIYKKVSTSFIVCCLLFIGANIAHAQSVDILWQGETYTPPFYQGRALWSKQSMITMVAVPQGLGSPSSLIYKWTQDGTVLGNISGQGRNTLRFEDSIFSKARTIKVEILSVAEEVLAESQIIVVPTTYLPLVYEDNPLLGYMFHKEVGNIFNLEEGEVTFSAFPLFSTPALRDGANLVYRWVTNSGDTETSNSVTYRAPDGEEGSSQVSLTISNKSKIMADISRSFLVQFGPVRD